MTYLATLLLIIITALPLSEATENNLREKVIDSSFGNNLRLESSAKETPSVNNEKEFLASPLPYKKPNYIDFTSWGKSTKVIDLATNKILYEKNPDQKLQIASLTKIMTAIVAYENTEPDEVITVPELKNMPEESTMGLASGEKIKAKELLRGILIHSAGDASYALAVHISETENEFVKLMNKRAGDMMLKSTHFSNSSGYTGTENYSTANDLLILTRLFLNNEELKNIVSQKRYQAKNETGKIYNLETTNKLLDNKKVFGIKTGYTPQAGECLITLAKEDDHEILTIVLGSPDRFAETNSFINWAYSNWSW